MLFLYNIGVRLYFVAIYLASFFNRKAGSWIEGRKRQDFAGFSGCFWFHFASLGEFEQGRPVLEMMKKMHREEKIVITFFSPSGYEVRKNTPLADVVYYLPLDTRENARQFLDAVQPKIAVFTKYEYWFHFFYETHSRHIPLYVISAIFRPKQIFFKWYGGLHRSILSFVSYFFVQDEQSKQLLSGLGINNSMVSGDTRFDRVWTNSQYPKAIPGITDFKNGHKVFIAGSTWPPDEKLIASLVKHRPDWKFIIAPHEINEEKIKQLIEWLPAGAAVRYSGYTPTAAYQVLIIDNIGILSSLYQYGNIAYIGGGFGAGIHNTLEAAAFGLPVIFGPEYAKFKEAQDLINLKAGFSVADEVGLQAVTNHLINDQIFFNTASTNSRAYVKEHTGATGTIIDYIKIADQSHGVPEKK